jgi:hypothetical protein
MIYNLFLDDIRSLSDAFYFTKQPIYNLLDWKIVRSYDEFIKFILENGIPETISFDHDLADEHYDPDLYGSETYNETYDNFEFKTGYDCAKWLINYCMSNNENPPVNILVHSANYQGSINIVSLFNNYFRSIGSTSIATRCI